jgi:hypothetical protein
MVAEPFIFLTEDRQVDVRCCFAGDTPFFCVVDFIRRTSKRRMGPLDALQYWMHISLGLQQSEHDIANAFLHRFPGPYEKPNVCVNANGLLILYHHMDAMHGLVDERYRSEVTERLLQVEGGRGRQFIEDYDDGEIDAQMEEEGRRGLTEPPRGSRFWYVPSTKTGEEEENGDAEIPVEAALLAKTEENVRLQSALGQAAQAHEAEKRRLLDTTELLQKRIAELEQAHAQRRKADAFSLAALARQAGIHIPAEHANRLCKSVVARFRREFPGLELQKRHNVVHFPHEHEDTVERIMRAELMQLELAQLDKGHAAVIGCWNGGAGATMQFTQGGQANLSI